MVEDSKASTSASSGTPLRRALTGEESAQFRHRPPANRFSTAVGDVPSPGLRRRSSAFSDYSINEARKSFQESADDVLLPTPNGPGSDTARVSSNWDSAPLVFALLPAVGGMFFTNGSAVITDIMLLGLAAIFLNWSVRLPWNWYHSAQAIRKKEEYNGDIVIDTDSEDENALSFSQSSLDKVPEEGADGEVEMESDVTPKPAPKTARRLPAHEAASTELYTHEMLALLSCFVFPVLGAYLLHTIRSQLTRPSEGLVSNYNLTIFLLASELRPMSHLVKLIQSRTLHLQRVVNSNPYDSVSGKPQGDVKELVRRIEELEARPTTPTEALSGNGTTEQALSAKQIATLATEVRRTLQPELDALNRAVRRYEKRQTLQTFQTESRLHELEGRLSDAISLAAAAANNGHSRHGFSTTLVEWVAAAFVLPLQAFGALASLPFKTIITLINYGKVIFIGRSRRPIEKGRKSTNGKYPSHSRMGADRLQGRVTKR